MEKLDFENLFKLVTVYSRGGMKASIYADDEGCAYHLVVHYAPKKYTIKATVGKTKMQLDYLYQELDRITERWHL